MSFIDTNLNLIKSLINENLSFDNISSFQNLVFISILILIAYYVYLLITFNEIIMDMSQSKLNKSETKASNNNDDLPPFYPNGWIPILESRNIKLNEVKPIIAFGYELVAFRGNSGQVYVLDAFCPHLGANLGVGGKVVSDCDQDCIKCPFHGWTFRGSDGLCVKIPQFDCTEDNESQIPKANMKVWENIEINGIIFVWYHSDGKIPQWLPIKIQEIQDSKWIYRGRTEHIVNCHFQEIPENGADIAHLNELHKPGVIFGTNLDKFPFYHLLSDIVYHEWQSNWWSCSAPNNHIAMMTLENKNKLFGYTVLDLNFSIQQIGPACVHLEFNTSILGIRGAFIQIITPLEPFKHRIVHHVYTEPTFKGKLFSKFLLYGEARMIERDILIWNNKKFLKSPIFTKNEKSLVKFRRWFNQFYSHKSLNQTQW